MISVVLCYSPGDEVFAKRLTGFIEINLPLAVSCGEGVVGPDLDLLEATERALSAEVALVLLSPSSVPKVWNRGTWEPLFLERPKEFQTQLGFVLVSGCKFPELLRRERFFDASADALAAMREIKRWLLRPMETVSPVTRAAPEMEEVRRAVADRPGAAAGIDPGFAVHFAGRYGKDFEAVHLFDCSGRSRAGIAGDVGAALGLSMSGTLNENRAQLSEWCATHRVLFVLAGVGAEDRDFATLGGRASVIFMGPLTGALPGSIPSPVAEAVRRVQQTQCTDAEAGLRSGWMAVNILKAQERFAEVREVLDAMARIARDCGETDGLRRIKREQFWMEDDQKSEDRGPLEGEQLKLPFQTGVL